MKGLSIRDIPSNSSEMYSNDSTDLQSISDQKSEITVNLNYDIYTFLIKFIDSPNDLSSYCNQNKFFIIYVKKIRISFLNIS